uniref:Uncharacterized protein n=1 Tax=Panagrolaimus davidi TaxID=227884 RepID=A0A914QK98_9BILA
MKDLGLGTCLGFELEHCANFRAKMSLPHEIKSVSKSIDELLSIDGIQPAILEYPVTIIEDEPMEVTAAEKPKTEQVRMKTTTTRTLSVEQQIFFKEIMETIMGSDETKRTHFLLGLSVGISYLESLFGLPVRHVAGNYLFLG